MTPQLTTLSDPHGAAAEAYQSLRTSLEFSRLGQEVTTLLLAAVDGGSDKSSAAANLAVVMAQAGDRVILVDGDLRRPQQAEIFGLPNQQGLSTWLQAGGDPPLQNTGVEGLQVLASGPVSGNPVALLSAKRLCERLASLRQRADYVIIDAPPVLPVADALEVGRYVDAVVLVAKAGTTQPKEAQLAAELLIQVGAPLVGTVLNSISREMGDGYAFEYYEDLDDDGMYDGWESEYGVDPSRDDAAEDPDGDHLTNLEEFGIGTIPTSFDSDNDGTPDAIEVDNGFDPIDSGDAPEACALSLFAGAAPVAWFALDDASGAVFADGIGDLDATVTGGVTDAEGKVDRAALFDGATGFATAAVPATASSFAWAAWVRVDTLPASDLAVAAAHGVGPEPDTGWMLAVDAAGIPRFVLEGGSSVDRQVLLGWEVAPGAWTHFAISFEDGIANMYQDGNHVRRVETPFPAVTFGTNPFTLGYDPSATGRWFAGAVDQVAYWNTSLAHSDVYGLVNDDTCDLASF